MSGFISNKYGRSLPTKICIILNFIFSVLSTYTYDIPSMFFCRLTMGICLGIIIPTQTTLLVESIPNKNRGLIMNSCWLPFPLGIIFVCLLSIYYIKPKDQNNEFHWRQILFVNSLLSLIIAVLILNMKESPRYLLLRGRGRAKELIDILNDIGKYSNNELTDDEKDYFNFLLDEPSDSLKNLLNKTNLNSMNYNSNKDSNAIEKRSRKFHNEDFIEHYNQFYEKYNGIITPDQKNDLDFFCTKKNKLLNYLLVIVWFVSSFISLALFYILPKFYEKIHDKDKAILLKNLIYSCIIILPCPIVRGILADIKVIGRKYTLVISFLGSGIMSVICMFLNQQMFVTAGFLKFFINISVGIVQVYTVEVYPTNIRSLAIGFGNGLSRLTGFFTPFICEYLETLIKRGSLYGFFTLCVFGVLAAYYLPYETVGKTLDFMSEKSEEEEKIVSKSDVLKKD